MKPRHAASLVLAALRDRPVVFLNGPRQAGKTTLARHLAGGKHPARYLTLDDNTVRSAASSDPEGFLASERDNLVLDEVQLAPGLFPAIKASVDRDRRPGRFLLTGSSQALVIPGAARSLVGRMEVVTLWPFSQSEIGETRGRFLDLLISAKAHDFSGRAEPRSRLISRISAGGYPEAAGLRDANRRQAWFRSYAATILQRDIRTLADIEGLNALPRLLEITAARAGGLLNYAELSRSTGIPQSTLKRYFALLQATFLVTLLPAWSGNPVVRLIRLPKLHLADTGLMAHLLSVGDERIAGDPVLFGRILEDFVVTEAMKLAAASEAGYRISHYRDAGGREVDLVVENADGGVAGIEVKAAASVGAGDFNGLKALARAAGRRFIRGAVLYTGNEKVAFGTNLLAIPVQSLWE